MSDNHDNQSDVDHVAAGEPSSQVPEASTPYESAVATAPPAASPSVYDPGAGDTGPDAKTLKLGGLLALIVVGAGAWALFTHHSGDGLPPQTQKAMDAAAAPPPQTSLPIDVAPPPPEPGSAAQATTDLLPSTAPGDDPAAAEAPAEAAAPHEDGGDTANAPDLPGHRTNPYAPSEAVGAAWDCRAPLAPQPIDGLTASAADIREAERDVKVFLNDSDAYQQCLEMWGETHLARRPDAEAAARKSSVQAHRVADRFNRSLHDFKARGGGPD
jgi:hypothetical protein